MNEHKKSETSFRAVGHKHDEWHDKSNIFENKRQIYSGQSTHIFVSFQMW